MRHTCTILCLMLLFNISVSAQQLGDYIEIGGMPAFVFYLDETGQHGLAMSMPALSPKQLKGIDRYVKKELMTETQAEYFRNGNKALNLDAYKKRGMLKKKAKEELFGGLITSLNGDGKNNASAIESYCQKKGLSMKDYFPWEYWASQLGDGWYIPGDNELEKFAVFFCGGLNKSNGIGSVKWATQYKHLSSDKRVQYFLGYIGLIGLMSSTAKNADSGFRTLHKISTTIPSRSWYELIDNLIGKDKEMVGVKTCAVHEF